MSEADLIDHNRLYPDHKMVSVTPSEGTPAFEFSLVNVATDPVRDQAVELLRAYLMTPTAAKIFAQYGIRSTAVPVTMPTPQGSVGEVKIGPSPDAETVTAATNVWQSATTDFSILSVFDVSGSMNEKVGDTTRVAITQEAAGIALAALPKTTKLGLWIFSIDKGGPGQDWRELAPIGRLDDDSHRAVVATAASTLAKNVGGGTGLYDTIWAAYQKVKSAVRPEPGQRRRHPHRRPQRGPEGHLARAAQGQPPRPRATRPSRSPSRPSASGPTSTPRPCRRSRR